VVEDLAQRRERVCLFAEIHVCCKTRCSLSFPCRGFILCLLVVAALDTQHTTQLSNIDKLKEWK
jgi:hypothetical protein